MTKWHPTSWQEKTNLQSINYVDQVSLEKCLEKLRKNTPLVNKVSINSLSSMLAKASDGELFIIQGGDCAERINAPLESTIKTIELLDELSEIISSNINKPVIAVGRIAGQFAKPRSELFDKDNNNIPSYRGDMINKPQANIVSRMPEPIYMLRAYNKSKQIVEYIEKTRQKSILGYHLPHVFTSHEAVNLYYDSSLTRKIDNKYYNLSTHFPWVGIRSNNIDGAHIEYMTGIANPIAIKIDKDISFQKIDSLMNKLNPENIKGRLTFITRFGKSFANEILTSILPYTQKMNYHITWMCDPMHGNIKKLTDGKKTRSVEDIILEIYESIKVHKIHGSHLAGIHLECSKDDILECQDKEDDKIQKSLVDPRLNYRQSKNVINKMCQFINTGDINDL